MTGTTGSSGTPVEHDNRGDLDDDQFDETEFDEADFHEADVDEADLDADPDGPIDDPDGGSRPVVAVIGRPNVGKSTLVNRILGRREAVVEDVPGVTRDRVTYRAEWAGQPFTLVDTGGWDARASGISARVAAQAETAIALSDAVLFVVDATVGATTGDDQLVRLLRKAGKPVVLAANKVDDARGETDATALWSLGLGNPFPVSAMHGRGTGDLLDAVIEAARIAPPRPESGPGLRRVALVGRPNVGKSSMLNALARAERVIVDPVAGTTRDPVDEVVEIDGRSWLFIDTAGLRRKHRQADGADFFSGLRTQAAIERCEVAVVVLDGSEALAEQDVRVVSMTIDAGRALVLAVNKWDHVDEERQRYLERELERDLGHASWAPRVNLSALTGRHLARLVPALDLALASWDSRVPTARLNALMAEIAGAHPHPVRGGKQPRILYATQASSRPPTFVLFTTGFLEAGYRRFVERRLRETFGFEGTPVHINVRAREKRRRS